MVFYVLLVHWFKKPKQYKIFSWKFVITSNIKTNGFVSDDNYFITREKVVFTSNYTETAVIYAYSLASKLFFTVNLYKVNLRRR